MSERDWLAERFEQHRPHLRAVAYRMLGSLDEADDAVQEAWLRLSRTDTSAIENLGGWLTTVVARVCLDMLRVAARRAARSRPTPGCPTRSSAPTGVGSRAGGAARRLGRASRCSSCSRRSRRPSGSRSSCTTCSASRSTRSRRSSTAPRRDPPAREPGAAPGARRRAPTPSRRPRRARRVVDAFLAAARGGDFEALVAVLDPDVVLRTDHGAAARQRRASSAARQAVARERARGSRALAPLAQPALVNGDAGFYVAPRGRLFAVVGVHRRRRADHRDRHRRRPGQAGADRDGLAELLRHDVRGQGRAPRRDPVIARERKGCEHRRRKLLLEPPELVAVRGENDRELVQARVVSDHHHGLGLVGRRAGCARGADPRRPRTARPRRRRSSRRAPAAGARGSGASARRTSRARERARSPAGVGARRSASRRGGRAAPAAACRPGSVGSSQLDFAWRRRR